MKKILSVLFCCLVAACSAAVDTDTAPEDPSVMPFKGTGNLSTSGNLVDHGGVVLSTNNTYAIWWGNPAGFPADAQSGMDNFFNGLTGTSFLAISYQYMRGPMPVHQFHTNWVDTSAPPKNAPSTSQIGSEVCKMIGLNHQLPDPNGIYFVYTTNMPHANYCAWHSWGKCGGTPIQIAYMPNTTGVAGCDPGNLYNCNSYSQGTRSLANVTSHEYMEAITDPNLNAWYDNGGAEIGDKCAWKFSGCVNLTTGSWQLQQEWSNASSSCVQQ